MGLELKPCPFCGSSDIYLHETRTEGVVICNDCDARGSDSTNFFDPVCPMDLWNKRHVEDQIDTLVEAKNEKLETALREISDRFEGKLNLHKEDCFAYQVAKKALD